MGERIPGARVAELPGDDHLPWEGDQEGLLDEIARFLTGITGEEAELDRVLATILFTDIVDSAVAAEPGDHARRELVGRFYGLVRAELGRFRGRELDRIGDGVLAIFDGPARAIRCAHAICQDAGRLGLGARAGLHTGEVELSQGKVHGIAVDVGGKVAAQARPGEVLVSRTVKDLVAGSGIGFEDQGRHVLEGADEWGLLAVKSV
jgi:class 3 adenylate cyclase